MPASAQSIGARLTAKVGPLPVWGWVVLIVGAYLAYIHFRGASSSSPGNAATPMAAAADTTGVGGGSGNGNAADNVNSDLLAALLQQNQQGYDALTNALYATSAYAGAGGTTYNTTTTDSNNPVTTTYTNYIQATGGGTSPVPAPSYVQPAVQPTSYDSPTIAAQAAHPSAVAPTYSPTPNLVGAIGPGRYPG